MAEISTVLAAPAPAPEPDEPNRTPWLTTLEFAKLAGINRGNAHAALLRCLNGATWRRSNLEVGATEGIGGKGGKVLRVNAASLPADLHARWKESYQISAPVTAPPAPPPPAPSTYQNDIAARFAEMRWKLEILAPALDHPPCSRARGEALRDIAGKEYTRPDGRRVTPKRSTLAEWIRKLNTEGEAALPRKRPAPGIPRVIISRAWDAACPLPEDEKRLIRADLETYLKTEWASGVPGVNRVRQFASSKLVELSRVRGWAAASLAGCDVGRYLAEQFQEYSLVAEKERNAKKFFDSRLPRIRINRGKLQPGDVVVGDVHHFDVAKADGMRTVHAKLICWLDLATYDIFVTVVICGEGRSIRQEDVAGSFVDMVEAWGLPKQLRLDNGKEFKWDAMMDGFNTLAGLVRDYRVLFLPNIMGEGEKAELLDGYSFEPRHTVSRARPYNAPAKQIESVFGIIEYGFFSLMPGWVAGDRMNKRTHKIGEAPKAYDGTDAEFLRDINICLDLYRNTPPKGGSSPNDKRRVAYDAGCTPVRVDRAALRFAFSEIRRFTVHPSGVQVDGLWGICDALVPLIGQKVDIRVVKWDRSHTFYLDPARKLHALPMGRTFDHDDPAGSKEQARMTKVLNTNIQELKAETTDMDILAEAARHLTHMPPAPKLPAGPVISTTEGTAIAAALATAASPPVVRLKPGERIHPTTGALLAIARPLEENRPGGKEPPGPCAALPPPALPPEPKPDQVATRFDLLKNLQAGSQTNVKESP
jgi:hypothetical protein